MICPNGVRQAQILVEYVLLLKSSFTLSYIRALRSYESANQSQEGPIWNPGHTLSDSSAFRPLSDMRWFVLTIPFFKTMLIGYSSGNREPGTSRAPWCVLCVARHRRKKDGSHQRGILFGALVEATFPRRGFETLAELGVAARSHSRAVKMVRLLLESPLYRFGMFTCKKPDMATRKSHHH